MISTTAKEFFDRTKTLLPGESISMILPTQKKATSFRVSLYRVKNDLKAFEIDISISETTVTLTKTEGEITYIQTSKDGVSRVVTHSFKNEREEEKVLKKEAYAPLTLQEQADFYNSNISKIHSSNDPFEIKRYCLKKLIQEVFQTKENERNFFITRTEDGLPSYAHIRTEEEKLNEAY